MRKLLFVFLFFVCGSVFFSEELYNKTINRTTFVIEYEYGVYIAHILYPISSGSAEQRSFVAIREYDAFEFTFEEMKITSSFFSTVIEDIDKKIDNKEFVIFNNVKDIRTTDDGKQWLFNQKYITTKEILKELIEEEFIDVDNIPEELLSE